MADDLPTTFAWGDQVRRIRLTPTALLIWMVTNCSRQNRAGRAFYAMNGAFTVDCLRAMVRELRRRAAVTGGPLLHRMNSLDPPPCACGKVGLYIVGSDTYCDECRPVAIQRRTRWALGKDAQAARVGAAIDALYASRDSSRKHHQAMGRRHPRRK